MRAKLGVDTSLDMVMSFGATSVGDISRTGSGLQRYIRSYVTALGLASAWRQTDIATCWKDADERRGNLVDAIWKSEVPEVQ